MAAWEAHHDVAFYTPSPLVFSAADIICPLACHLSLVRMNRRWRREAIGAPKGVLVDDPQKLGCIDICARPIEGKSPQICGEEAIDPTPLIIFEGRRWSREAFRLAWELGCVSLTRRHILMQKMFASARRCCLIAGLRIVASPCSWQPNIVTRGKTKQSCLQV